MNLRSNHGSYECHYQSPKPQSEERKFRVKTANNWDNFQLMNWNQFNLVREFQKNHSSLSHGRDVWSYWLITLLLVSRIMTHGWIKVLYQVQIVKYVKMSKFWILQEMSMMTITGKKVCFFVSVSLRFVKRVSVPRLLAIPVLSACVDLKFCVWEMWYAHFPNRVTNRILFTSQLHSIPNDSRNYSRIQVTQKVDVVRTLNSDTVIKMLRTRKGTEDRDGGRCLPVL